MPKKLTEKTNPKGRVNIDLGENKEGLDAIAGRESVTSGAMARMMVLNGIKRYEAGVLRFQKPALIEREKVGE